MGASAGAQLERRQSDLLSVIEVTADAERRANGSPEPFTILVCVLHPSSKCDPTFTIEKELLNRNETYVSPDSKTQLLYLVANSFHQRHHLGSQQRRKLRTRRCAAVRKERGGPASELICGCSVFGAVHFKTYLV